MYYVWGLNSSISSLALNVTVNWSALLHTPQVQVSTQRLVKW